MSADIVERLKSWDGVMGPEHSRTVSEAAGEITRLRTRVEELEGALKEIKKLGWETVREQHAHAVAHRALTDQEEGDG